MIVTAIETAAGENNTLSVELLTLKKAASVLRAINHGVRMEMLQLLHQKEALSVGEIFRQMDMDQSVASQHLAILRRAGMVRTRRAGKHIFYSVNYDRLHEVEQQAAALLHR